MEVREKEEGSFEEKEGEEENDTEEVMEKEKRGGTG